jgi:tetratricopeptide (TPR) repeat protein
MFRTLTVLCAKNKLVLCIFLVIITAISMAVTFIHFKPDSTYSVLTAFHVPSTIIGRIYSDNPKILYKIGSSHMGGGSTYDRGLAERFVSAAIELDEQLPYAHYQRARLYFLDERYAKAIIEVNKELEYNPNFSRSYYLRGLIHGYNGQYTEAAADFAEFIKRKPEEWAGYADRAWVLFQLGDYQGVLETMEAILPKTRNAWLLNAYGVALLNTEREEAALEALLEAQDLASRMTPEMWGMAYVGNDPRIYRAGLEEMRKNIDENIERVNNALSQK